MSLDPPYKPKIKGEYISNKNFLKYMSVSNI